MHNPWPLKRPLVSSSLPTGKRSKGVEEDNRVADAKQIFKEGLQLRILECDDIEVSLENFPYYLSETTKNVLISSTCIQLKCSNTLGVDLPSCVCPGILLSGPAGTEIYRETLAKALDKHYGVKLIIVDSLVFSSTDVRESSRPETSMVNNLGGSILSSQTHQANRTGGFLPSHAQ